MQIKSLFLSVALGVCLPGWAAPEALEVWLHQPRFALADFSSDGGLGDMQFGGNPTTSAVSSTLSVNVQGISIQDSGLTLSSILATLNIGELKCELTSPIRQTLFAFKNIRITLKSRRPMVLGFPQSILLRTQASERGTQFVLADDRLKAHFETQIDSTLNAREFDAGFEIRLEGELSGIAQKEGQKFLDNAKPQLLDQARSALKKALSQEALNRALALDANAIPIGIPESSLDGDWSLQQVQRGTWRLARTSARPVASAISQGQAGTLSVVASKELIESLTQTFASKSSPDLTSEESEAIAELLELDPSTPLEWIATGERGPRIGLWGKTELNQRYFSDLLWCFRNKQTGEQYPVGLILELGAQTPKLRAVARQTSGKWISLPAEKPGVLAKMQKMVDARLAELYTKWIETEASYRVVGMRTVGDAGERIPGKPADRWAHSLVIDYQLK